MPRHAYLAATVLLSVALGGCASKPQSATTSARGPVPAARASVPTSAASTTAATSTTSAAGDHSCPPRITPTPDGHGAMNGVAIDYVDVLRFNGHDYQATDNRSLTQADLGAGVSHVACTLAGPSTSYVDPHYQMKDGDATFVPAGSTIYTVKGVPADRELAAEHDGVMHAYRVLSNG